jgi:hypothetical protein
MGVFYSKTQRRTTKKSGGGVMTSSLREAQRRSNLTVHREGRGNVLTPFDSNVYPTYNADIHRINIKKMNARNKHYMTPPEQVHQAFLHLCWAIKLDSYLKVHPPANKVDFDNHQSILDPTDTLHLPDNQFDTINDILLGAENSIRLSAGALFLALDTALEEAGFKTDPSAQDAFGQLRILIYMCRCAFAHNVLAPHWNVNGQYRRQLKIALSSISLQLDLNQLAGQPFDIHQIGGYSQLFKIKDHILQILDSKK